VYGLAVDGDFLYVAYNQGGMPVIDVSDPANPILVATYSAGSVRVAAEGSILATIGGGVLRVYNVADALAPVSLGYYPVIEGISQMEFVDNRLVTINMSQMSVYEIDALTDAKSPPILPQQFELLTCYPNPFNSTLNISLEVPLHQEITITLYDLLGREVDVLHRGRLETSTLSYSAPPTLASGIYFIKAATASQAQMLKVVLLK